MTFDTTNEVIGKNTLDIGFPAEERQPFTDKLIENGDVSGPDIPIVICTGYNPKIDEKTALAIGLKAFIFKPLTFQKLATTVRNVLDNQQN